MTKPSDDRITEEARTIAELAQQLAKLRTPTARKKAGKGRRAVRALGKITARLESVRLILSAAVEDLSTLTQEG